MGNYELLMSARIKIYSGPFVGVRFNPCFLVINSLNSFPQVEAEPLEWC